MQAVLVVEVEAFLLLLCFISPLPALLLVSVLQRLAMGSRGGRGLAACLSWVSGRGEALPTLPESYWRLNPRWGANLGYRCVLACHLNGEFLEVCIFI